MRLMLASLRQEGIAVQGSGANDTDDAASAAAAAAANGTTATATAGDGANSTVNGTLQAARASLQSLFDQLSYQPPPPRERAISYCLPEAVVEPQKVLFVHLRYATSLRYPRDIVPEAGKGSDAEAPEADPAAQHLRRRLVTRVAVGVALLAATAAVAALGAQLYAVDGAGARELRDALLPVVGGLVPFALAFAGFLVLRFGTFRVLSVDVASARYVYNHRETDERIFEVRTPPPLASTPFGAAPGLCLTQSLLSTSPFLPPPPAAHSLPHSDCATHDGRSLHCFLPALCACASLSLSTAIYLFPPPPPSLFPPLQALVEAVEARPWAYSLAGHPLVDALRLAPENYGDRLFIHPPLFVYSMALLRRVARLPLPGYALLCQVRAAAGA